jgi:enolase
MDAINKAGYKPGEDVFIALDVAASEFYNKESNTYRLEDKDLSRYDLLNYYGELINNYPIISIEDPFDENDYDGFKSITQKYGEKIQIVGDDLFVTNEKLLKIGIEEKLANAILIKPNQIGTFSETVATVLMAQRANYGVIISHRSGETEDVTIAHLAVGLGAGQIKTGSLSRSERIAKYNELIRIAEKQPGLGLSRQYERLDGLRN